MADWDAARAALPDSWRAAIGDELDTPAMRALAAFLAAERAEGKQVFPADSVIFEALRRTPLDRVRAVILGQDPYHRPGQAMGLSFSVPPGVTIPPSLRNIYKERAADLGLSPPGHGCLTAWADRGVLLLNTSLTVEEGRAGSHARAGWQRFTDRVIAAVNAQAAPAAFILWGGHAQKKAGMLDAARHLVHRSEHPSPLSAYRGFFGSRPFSKVNAFLRDAGAGEIDWSLPG
ncbi:MAG: uracil-DNA glycosylase [Janthinobacterium lividum]